MTVIGPVVEPAGTEVKILVADKIVNGALEAVPLNFTYVTPVKLVPVRVTLSPGPPVVGVIADTSGDGITVKLVAVVSVNVPRVSEIAPVVAVAGTVAVTVVAVTVGVAAATPLKRAAVVPVKFTPVMVTTVPAGPDVGENDVMDTTLKATADEVTEPNAFVNTAR